MMDFTKKAWVGVVLTVIIVGLLSGGGAYYAGHVKSEDVKKDLQSQIDSMKAEVASIKTDSVAVATPTPTPAVSATPDVTLGWMKYGDKDYAVSFKYPSSLGSPKTETIKLEDGGPGWQVKENAVVFGDNNPYVDLTTFENLLTAPEVSEKTKSDVASLKNIFKDRQTSLTTSLWLPPINASIVRITKPKYIENSSGTYRGIYYYSYISQNPSEDEMNGAATIKLNDVTMLLSDGTNKVIQIHSSLSSDSTESKTYTYKDTPCSSSTGSASGNCKLNEQIESNLEGIYKNMVRTIE